MAAVAAALSAATTSLSTLHLTKPSSLKTLSRTHRHFRTIITSSLSRSSTSIEFNITFAPSKPKPKLEPESNAPDQLGKKLFIPWIVRDEKGDLSLQETPPPRLLHALADAKTKPSAAKKKKKEKESSSRPLTSEPKFSKAARRFYNEKFRDPPQRLSKVLAASGVAPLREAGSSFSRLACRVASRRSCEELIFEGRVTVNGSLCKTPQTRVDPAKDMIYVNGNRLPKKLPPKVYLALNKPKGYICSSGEKETKSVLSLFEDYMKSWNKINPGQPKPRLFTVGRLDVATTGLIIVTNDGEFAQKLSHPSSGLSKEYIASVDGAVNNRHLLAISEGTVIDGTHCTPDAVELLPRDGDKSKTRVRIVQRVGGSGPSGIIYGVLEVHEGRNHEVRELVKNAGLQIYSLKRIRIGAFRLPADLGLGKHIELKPANLRALGWEREKKASTDD